MAGAPVNVLIVDDQAPFRRAAAAVVGVTPGFQVVGEADSGEAAIELVETLHPDYVLMDINLPGMSGVEATRRITTCYPDVVVMLVSTYGADDLPADMGESGSAAYVNKDEFGPVVLKQVWEDAQP
jgi:two-component system invasion response regulator UvrY